jgi:hypothetical protein
MDEFLELTTKKEVVVVDTSKNVSLMEGHDHDHEEGEEHDHEEEEHDHGPNDPHFWLDPRSAKVQVDNILAAFVEADPDNADFYDRGNGKIRIAITGYKGDGTADAVGAGDPYFIIRVDTNNDGIMDLTYTSQVFTDKENLTGPYSVTIDLPDDSKTVRFSISVFDDNNAADRPIDYAPGSATVQTHTVNAPFFGSWTYDGDDDKRKEIDCELSYTISAVG